MKKWVLLFNSSVWSQNRAYNFGEETPSPPFIQVVLDHRFGVFLKQFWHSFPFVMRFSKDQETGGQTEFVTLAVAFSNPRTESDRFRAF